MTPIHNSAIYRIIRLSRTLSLIFFVLLFAACKQPTGEEVTITWKNKQAVEMTVPKSLLKSQAHISTSNFQVRLQHNVSKMLGNYTESKNQLIFTPLIPFCPGLTYEVLYRNNLIDTIKIPFANPAQVTRLLGVYPTPDTLPENLLKIYIAFSAPMREGEALRHVALSDNQNNTLPGIFLDLQPELWNNERTILTIWLDPGRIKRDLIPNRKKGNPLRQGKQYTLSVSSDWKDIQGLPLQAEYRRKFTVGARDSISPRPARWKLQLPKQGTGEPLNVHFGEALDYFLVSETIRLVDETGKELAGTLQIIDMETGFQFFPLHHWLPGHYTIRIASKLEDLAGNNLNRLFDRDMRVKQLHKDSAFFTSEFVVGPK